MNDSIVLQYARSPKLAWYAFVILTTIGVFCLGGCALLQSAAPPKPTTPDEYISLAYTEITAAYDDVVRLRTPTVAGAKPLLEAHQAQAINHRLDLALQKVMTVDALWQAGKGYDGEQLAQARAILVQIRQSFPVEVH